MNTLKQRSALNKKKYWWRERLFIPHKTQSKQTENKKFTYTHAVHKICNILWWNYYKHKIIEIKVIVSNKAFLVFHSSNRKTQTVDYKQKLKNLLFIVIILNRGTSLWMKLLLNFNLNLGTSIKPLKQTEKILTKNSLLINYK